MKFPSYPFVFTFCVLTISSCKKAPVTEDDLFKLGKTENYQIESTKGFKVADPVSGCTFAFPDGGSGELTVSGIQEGPQLNEIVAERFKIDYTGTGKVELLVPLSDNYIQAYVYGPITGAAVKPNIGEFSWGVMIEQDTVDGYLRYEINIGDLKKSLKTGVSKYNAPESKYFALSDLKPGSTDWNKLVALYKSVQQVADIWLSSLPADVQSEYRAKMNDNMRFDIRLSSSNYYQHFDNWVWGKNAIFFLKPDIYLSGVAHETGHYMTHLLCGFSRYSEIYAAMPSKYWGLGGTRGHLFGGYIQGRSYLLEDYAHFSEFLVTGKVEDHDLYNVADINYFAQVATGKPDQVDYPSHEGFGAAMLAALMRTDTKIHYFDTSDKSKIKVPVVNAKPGDIINNVLRHGPRNVNELYTRIQSYLESRGQEDASKLPAMLEPLGWSYSGKGILIDGDDDPVKGARIRSMVIADQEYPGPMSVGTTEKGEFWVKRLPPGKSLIRVYHNLVNYIYEDSTDLEIFIDPLLKTTEEVNLGTLIASFQEKIETKSYTNLYNTRIYNPFPGYTGPSITSMLDFNASITQSVNNTVLIDPGFLESPDVSALISLYFTCKSNKPVTASFDFKWSLSDLNWIWVNIDQKDYISDEYTVTATPEFSEGNSGEGSYAPVFTWTPGSAGSVQATMTFDPKELFKDVASRRYSLIATFKAKRVTTAANGTKYTYTEYFTPSQVSIRVRK